MIRFFHTFADGTQITVELKRSAKKNLILRPVNTQTVSINVPPLLSRLRVGKLAGCKRNDIAEHTCQDARTSRFPPKLTRVDLVSGSKGKAGYPQPKPYPHHVV